MDYEKLNNDISEIQEELYSCIYPLEERNRTFESINDLSESIKDNSFNYKRAAAKTKNILIKN